MLWYLIDSSLYLSLHQQNRKQKNKALYFLVWFLVAPGHNKTNITNISRKPDHKIYVNRNKHLSPKIHTYIWKWYHRKTRQRGNEWQFAANFNRAIHSSLSNKLLCNISLASGYVKLQCWMYRRPILLFRHIDAEPFPHNSWGV